MSFHSVVKTVRIPLLLAIIGASLMAVSTSAQGQLPIPVAGRNSNLASGPAELVVEVINGQPVATKVRGDFLLKQDNEGSCAKGSRNPKNILCGGNDYGLVDTPGIDADDVVRDAGAGVYQSADGGDTWESTMLRGHVLDAPNSDVLLKHYKAFADVTVRSGAAGIAYFTGIAFKSNNNTSIAYVSTFLELNNREDTRTPFTHLYTTKIDSVPETLLNDPLTATAFIDKPWTVVLPPTGETCTINVPRPDGTVLTQRIPDSPLIVGYSIFLGLEKHPDLRLTAEMIVRVTNCGRNVSSRKLVGLGQRLNGMSLAASPVPGSKRVVGVWRRFADQYVDDALFAVVSSDGGSSWSSPRQIASICPFQQASTGFTARINTFPTVAIDQTNRISVAWSDRGRDPSTGTCLAAGQSRIVLSTSSNGSSWSAPAVVDPGNGAGHQITPSLTYGGGTMLLLWKDLRETASRYFDQFINEYPLILAANNLPLPQGAPIPPGPPYFHHTIELYSKMANASPGSLQWGPSVRVSQYKFGKSPGETDPTQKQWEIIDLRLFQKGKRVFDGDYADSAAPPMLPPDPAKKRSTWTFDTGQSGDPTFFGVWASNRDVHRVPEHTDPSENPGGIPYTPPGLTGTSWLDPTQERPACVPGVSDFTKTMDQNLYGARISRGLYAFSPGNNKQVTDFQRAYVVTARNDSALTKTYQFTIPVQFQTPTGGFVSFSQFAPFGGVNAVRIVTVAPKSTASRTVFIVPDTNPATTLNPLTLVRVDVTELLGGGGTGSSSSVYINSDATAPEIEAPEIEAPEIEATEVYTPEIEAAEITAHPPGAPEIEAPEIEATSTGAPEIEAPEIEAKSFLTPEIEATSVSAPEIEAPEIEAPEIEAAAITDVSWPVTNKGNTAAGYVVRPLVGGDLTPFHFQLVASRTVLIATSKDCKPAFATMSKVALNLKNANHLVNAATVITPEQLDNATIWIAPGETVLVTLRVRGPVTFDPAANPTVLNVTQQAIDTVALAAGVTTPPTFTQPATPNLVFLVQPTDVSNGGTFDPAIQVRARDNSGAVLPGLTINLLFGPGSPSGAELGGNSEMTNEVGVATFPELTVSGAGSGFTLVASAAGVSSTASNSFNVTNPTTFVVTNVADSGEGSLRQAIQGANGNGGSVNTITFNIPEPVEGPLVISLATPLPPITNSVVLDGYTQPGASIGNPRIVVTRNLSAPAEGFLGASGLSLSSGSSTVRGLIINRFMGPGITVISSNNVVRGNFIGTNEAGNEAAPNPQGISIGSSATGNFIGSDTFEERNIIGGNSEFGIMIEGSGNTIRGNVIGVDPNPEGPIGVPNGPETGLNGAGIMLLNGAANNYIGGSAFNPLPNWIGQNRGEGIVLSGGGVAGGTAAGSGNGIGINQIVANTGLGIDLGNDGKTANDEGDGDTGPNDLQNAPEVTAAVANVGSIIVSGRLSSTANTTFRVAVYLNSACPAGDGEGETFVGNFLVFADDDGTMEFATTFEQTATPGSFITAFASTLTDAEINPLELNSSEFSDCREVVSGIPPDGFNVVWVGGSPLEPTAWENQTNWNPQQVPTSEDDVFIQFSPDQPVVNNPGAAAGRLTLASGTTLMLDEFGLNAHGDVDATQGQVLGAAGVSMVNGSPASVAGNFGHLRVYGQVTASGPITAGNISIPGNFSPDDWVVSVSGTLSTEGAGILTMTAGSGILQTQDAVFAGGSTDGALTAGTLRINGSFTQSGNGQSFAASGTHRTIFDSLGDETISFANPNVEGSHFNDLRLDVSGDIGLTTNVVAVGQLITTGPVAPIVLGGGNTLEVRGLNVFRLVLRNAYLTSTTGQLTRFDDVTFESFTGTAPLLRINHFGLSSPFTMNNITFDTNPDLTAPFLAVVDFSDLLGLRTDIDLVNAIPALASVGCPRTQWTPFATSSITWNGINCSSFF